MTDPLLEDIRRVRAQRSIELAQDFDRAWNESRRRQFTLGVRVVSYSGGKWHVVFPPKNGSAIPDEVPTGEDAS